MTVRTQTYRDAGYFAARAILPAQDIVEGVVEVSVIEGNLGQLRINMAEDVPVSESRVRDMVLGAVVPGKPLQDRSLERALLLLSDLPGVQVQSSLEQGEQPGTSDLVVEVTAAPRLSGQMNVDNYGFESTGVYRVGAAARLNSPLRAGDNLDGRVMWSEGQKFGRVGYGVPVGANGARIGVSWSHLEYVLGPPYSTIGANGGASAAGVSITYPVIRARARNLMAQGALAQQDLNDGYSELGYETRKRVRGVFPTLVYEHRDALRGGGYVGASVGIVLGDLDIRTPDARELDEGSGGRQTQGPFVKLNYQLSRLQTVGSAISLYFAVGGQTASKNLDSVEKISIGGPRAVRAYAQGAFFADVGLVGTVELRYSTTPWFTVSAFYDIGWGKRDKFPLTGETQNEQTLQGPGIGGFLALGNRALVNATVAWRVSDPVAGVVDHVPQVYVQGVLYF